ncbi:putative membrane protein Ycf1 [Anopheles sinensis]|uniref:Putative membrane protein Ycf1 n=1 Tax=Anopheles sinensis TaxID=74873 RepID=A0A084VNY0_ANOSI|nr:putative membrane protein Ycf1 [Anopheles sinensis]
MRFDFCNTPTPIAAATAKTASTPVVTAEVQASSGSSSDAAAAPDVATDRIRLVALHVRHRDDNINVHLHTLRNHAGGGSKCTRPLRKDWCKPPLGGGATSKYTLRSGSFRISAPKRCLSVVPGSSDRQQVVS